MSQRPLKIVISGGGTGGHIFPAIAIADAIKAKAPGSEFLFIGAKGKMEMEKVPQAGYPIEGLWISGFQRNLSLKNLVFPIKLVASLWKARSILKKFRPDVVIGVGGYASGAGLRVAIHLGIKTLIQEQNSFPGITNRLLGKKADKICVAYEQMEKWFPKEKIILTGNPLRKNAVDIAGKAEEARRYFSIENDHPVVLIVGGSQGAKAINEAIHQNIDHLLEANLNIIWQTGTSYFQTAQQLIQEKDSPSKLKVMAFINRMDLAYAVAGAVVSRAGAMSISELSVVKKPVIFIPLPTAAEDHQTKNALRLVNKDAAIMVRNENATSELPKAILDLVSDEAKRIRLSKNIAQFALPDAAASIADEIIKLAAR
jgi:UDP-N-acetylglucosamine--N-acetylmuramyl-(pentapeptide) pyrophosphoryl-undecaprenol N-acetylglucosamine transferase